MSRYYDIFASYAHDDNVHGHIGLFIDQLKVAYSNEFPKSELTVFFDKPEIHIGDDWENCITRGLRRSRVFLAFTSPAYFVSEFCRREWQEWIDQEIATQVFGEGAFPIYTVALPALNPGSTCEQNARYLTGLADAVRSFAESIASVRPTRASYLRTRAVEIVNNGQPIIRQARQLSRRQALGLQDAGGELIPFFPDGVDELRRGALTNILRQLATGLRERTSLAQSVGNRRSYIPDYNRHFSGRIEELLALRKLLTDDKNGTFAGIYGLGGIGKTELAFAYAHAYGHYYPGGRYLLPCENARDLKMVLTRLEGNPLPVIEGEARDDLGLYYRLLIQSLRDHVYKEGRTLLVLDNVNCHELLAPDETDSLANFDGQLHLLATSRQDPPRGQNASGRIRWFPLDRLDQESARELLRKHRDFEKEDYAQLQSAPTHPQRGESDEYQNVPGGAAAAAASEIAILLGGFTLATELVGSFLAIHGSVSYAETAEHLRKDRLNQLDLAAEHRDTELRRHNNEKRLQSILDWTLQKLTYTEREILDFAAFLPPDYVVLPWLNHLAAIRYPELKSRDGNHPVNCWQKAITNLSRLSLLSRSPKGDADGRILRTHRLLQDYLQQQLRNEGGATAQSAYEKEAPLTTHLLNRGQYLFSAWVDHDHRWEINPLMATALHWLEKHEVRGTKLAAAIQSPLQSLARWAEAELVLRAALTLEEQRDEANSSSKSTALNNLARLLELTHRNSEAESLYKRALEIDHSTHEDGNPKYANHLNNLGELKRKQGKLEEAECLFREALSINTAVYGANHETVARNLNNLGLVLAQLKRFDNAEPMLKLAIAKYRACFGNMHHDLAAALNNLGSMLQELHRYKEAETVLSEALSILEHTFAPNHPQIGICLTNIAALHQKMGLHAEAEHRFRRALEIDEESFGPNHIEVATDLHNLSISLILQGRYTEAEPMMCRQIKIVAKAALTDKLLFGRLQNVVTQYAAFLGGRMGYSRQAIQQKVDALLATYGLSAGPS